MNQADGQQFSDDLDNDAGTTQADDTTTQETATQEDEQEEDLNDDLPQVSELDMLKQRAKLMGITHSGNIGLEALRAKVNAKIGEMEKAEENRISAENDEAEVESAEADAGLLNPLVGDTAGKTPARKLTLREQVRRDALALVRVRITCMDPKKKDLAGELLAVGNKYTGMVRKFVPYGEATDEGYHIPKILYDELNSRRFQNIRTYKDRRTGTQRVETTMAKEFAIEVLPQLDAEGLAQLAAAQAAAGSFKD